MDVLIKLISLFAIVFGIVLVSKPAFAQSETNVEEHERKHSIALSIGHTQVYKGFDNGTETWLSLPSWALDYSYKVCDKWAVGIQNEIILSDFDVESNNDNKIVTRSTPFSTMLAVSYFPLEFLSVFVAGGGEFAKEENFAMLRIGLEPSLEINERLEMAATLLYDYKIDGYNSFGFCLGMGFKF